jgi:hypothetical protein
MNAFPLPEATIVNIPHKRGTCKWRVQGGDRTSCSRLQPGTFPGSSAVRAGPCRVRVGAYRDRVGAYRDRVGAYRDRVGAYRDRVGAYRDRVGAYRVRVGAYRDRVGAYRVLAEESPRLAGESL